MFFHAGDKDSITLFIIIQMLKFLFYFNYFWYLVDLQEAVNLAAFVLLLLHLLREALSLALLDGVGVLERPASPPVGLPHVIAGVAAPSHTHTHTASSSKKS